MRSDVFEVEDVVIGGTVEQCVRGGRHVFGRIPDALHGVARIGVIGWGSQARAQAMNLRDTLAGTDVTVTVGLRTGSPSAASARAAGFHERDETLGEMFDVIAASDLVILLISDAAQVGLHDQIAAAMRPSATLGLSHGFLPAHLRTIGRDIAGEFSVVAVCPKGMGPSIRRLYEQGSEVDGAGINSSIAVHRDADGNATDRALAWAVGIGSPVVFESDIVEEAISDITGERVVLLGGPHAIAEALYRWYLDAGDDAVTAFARSTESLTGPLARTISTSGLRGVLDAVGHERQTFDGAYEAGYLAFAPLVDELYGDVESGDELRSVVRASERLSRWPLAALEGSRMWSVGDLVRSTRGEREVRIDPVVAGLFCAMVVATADTLRAHGHRWSEIANETVIEIVDSLIPYMHARGVAHMIDSCSVTARLGARKWAPRLQAAIEQQVLPTLVRDTAGVASAARVSRLDDHPLHEALAVMATYRPPVDIAVV
jgi:ketol-acid reductoisomerase